MAGDLFRLEKSKHPADALNAGSQHIYLLPVSYTHLTLPTICSV